MKVLKKNNEANLVVVVVTVKKRLFAEYHTGKHTPQTPHIQRVVIHL